MTHEDQRTRDIIAAPGDVALCRGLRGTDLAVSARRVVLQRYGRNELISQDDRGNRLYVVSWGHVAITRQNPEGDHQLPALAKPGEEERGGS